VSDLTAEILRMENKKIGGTLAAICKLLKDDGAEKRYYDDADFHELCQENKRLREALEKIANEAIPGCYGAAHNRYCDCPETVAREALSRPEGTPGPTTRDKE